MGGHFSRFNVFSSRIILLPLGGVTLFSRIEMSARTINSAVAVSVFFFVTLVYPLQQTSRAYRTRLKHSGHQPIRLFLGVNHRSSNSIFSISLTLAGSKVYSNLKSSTHLVLLLEHTHNRKHSHLQQRQRQTYNPSASTDSFFD